MKLLKRLKGKASLLKTELVAIYLSVHDNRTPLLAKVMIVLTVSYAFSPIDLIPDFIPIIGYLDDLILLPFMIRATIKLIPKEVMETSRIKARKVISVSKKIGIYSAIIILLLWLIILIVLYNLLFANSKSYSLSVN